MEDENCVECGDPTITECKCGEFVCDQCLFEHLVNDAERNKAAAFYEWKSARKWRCICEKCFDEHIRAEQRREER